MGEALGRNSRAVVHGFDGKTGGRHGCGQRPGVDLGQRGQVRGVWRFLVAHLANGVTDDGRLKLDPLPRLPRRRIDARFQHALQPVLVQFRTAMRARKNVAHALAFVFQRLVEKVHRACAIRATEHLAPYRVFNTPLGLAVAVQGFVHPADVLLNLLEQLLARLGKCVYIEGDVVVGANEGGSGREVVEYRAACTPLRRGATCLLPRLFELKAVAAGGRAAPLRCHAGHTRAGKAVQHHIAGVGVVQDGRHDGQVRHLGVVAVRLVDGVGLAYADINRQRLAAVFGARVVWLAVVRHKLRQPRVRAGGVVRRVGHGEDGFVRASRKAFLLAKGRVLQSFCQQAQVIQAPGAIIFECLAEAFDGAGGGRGCARGKHVRHRELPLLFLHRPLGVRRTSSV